MEITTTHSKHIYVSPKHATIELNGVKIVFEKEVIGLHDIVDAGNQFLGLIKNLQ